MKVQKQKPVLGWEEEIKTSLKIWECSITQIQLLSISNKSNKQEQLSKGVKE